MDATAVREALQASNASHRLWRMAKLAEKAEEARQHLSEAAQFRATAAKLDPDRTAPAWAEEQGLTAAGRDTHEELMAFYRAQGVL